MTLPPQQSPPIAASAGSRHHPRAKCVASRRCACTRHGAATLPHPAGDGGPPAAAVNVAGARGGRHVGAVRSAPRPYCSCGDSPAIAGGRREGDKGGGEEGMGGGEAWAVKAPSNAPAYPQRQPSRLENFSAVVTRGGRSLGGSGGGGDDAPAPFTALMAAERLGRRWRRCCVPDGRGGGDTAVLVLWGGEGGDAKRSPG